MDERPVAGSIRGIVDAIGAHAGLADAVLSSGSADVIVGVEELEALAAACPAALARPSGDAPLPCDVLDFAQRAASSGVMVSCRCSIRHDGREAWVSIGDVCISAERRWIDDDALAVVAEFVERYGSADEVSCRLSTSRMWCAATYE